MNVHEQIDRVGRWTPRTKIIVGLVAFALVIGVLYAMFSFGSRLADHRYEQDRKARDARIAVLEANAARHEQNERELAAENALLRKQNEATAEILRANDRILEGNASNLTKLLTERNKRYEEIDADNDFDSQLCGMCSDFASSGFPLSDATCGRCKTTPQAGR